MMSTLSKSKAKDRLLCIRFRSVEPLLLHGEADYIQFASGHKENMLDSISYTNFKKIIKLHINCGTLSHLFI